MGLEVNHSIGEISTGMVVMCDIFNTYMKVHGLSLFTLHVHFCKKGTFLYFVYALLQTSVDKLVFAHCFFQIRFDHHHH